MISKLRTGFYSLALQLAAVLVVSAGLVGCVGDSGSNTEDDSVNGVDGGGSSAGEAPDPSIAVPSSFVGRLPDGNDSNDPSDADDGSGDGAKGAPGAATDVRLDPQPCPWQGWKHKTTGDT